MGGWRRCGQTLTFLVSILAVCAGTLSYRAYHRYRTEPVATDDVVVFIPKGSSLVDITQRLYEANLLPGAWDQHIFTVVTRLVSPKGSLQAGEYAVAGGSSMEDIGHQIRSGTGIVSYPLTIPEGLTVTEVLERVRAMPILTGDITVSPPEGTLLPETWHVVRGDTRDAVIQRMRAAMTDVLQGLWSRRSPDFPLQHPEDALILASLVEKETSVPEERQQVAGVFLNRLRLKMPLQSDPTVIYGLSPEDGALDRPLLRADLRKDHPWNTYTRSGLPAGPIGNPGRLALEAVFFAPPTNKLYFVADGTGGHAFAKTLAEHNRNVARWRHIKRNRKKTLKLDKAFDNDAIRKSTEDRKGWAKIPAKANRETSFVFCKWRYRFRNCVEKFFGKMKASRGTAVALAFFLGCVFRCHGACLRMYGRLPFAKFFSVLVLGYLHLCIRPFCGALPLALMESADWVPSPLRLYTAHPKLRV